MKILKSFTIVVFLILSSSSSIYSFEEVSSRIRSLGLGFTGIIPDPYTDLLRNPAYLVDETDRFTAITIFPDYAYRSGIFLNPTPFIEGSRGGAVFTFERNRYYGRSTMENLFPLEYFTDTDKYSSLTGNLPPTDLTRSGRSFLSYPSADLKSIFGSFNYAIPVNKSFSIGVNYLRGLSGIGSHSVSINESMRSDEYSSYTRLHYYNNRYENDSEENLNSLRVGVRGNFSARYSLDLEISASRSRGKNSSESTRFSETNTIYPDTTLFTSNTSLSETSTDPADKEVVECNLFIHRQGKNKSLSVRLSLFSGDAVRKEILMNISTQNDSITNQSKNVLRSSAGWTGGLVGVGGGHERTDMPLVIYWGGFFGFMKGWQADHVENETGTPLENIFSTRDNNRWNTYIWQFNLATEYEITNSIWALFGGKTTALLARNRFNKRSQTFAEPGPGNSSDKMRVQDLITDASLTGGVAVRLTDRVKFDIYTPDLASMSSWILESFIIF